MCVTEMESQKQFTQTVVFLRLLTFLVTVSTSVSGQSITLTKVPTNRLTLAGESVVFTCKVTGAGTSSLEMMWYRGDKRVEAGDRFEIQQTNGNIDQSLIINNIELADNGIYSCRVGNLSRERTLEVVPNSWSPRCERTPSTGNIPVGDPYTITCTSTGHANTSLRWLVPGESGISSTLDDAQLERTGTKVSISYMDMIASSESPLLFVCEATLESLSESCSISVNDSHSYSVIPFVVVGLMSLIALLLFFVVLFILFRHRQCRFCREPMLEPNTVLDANSLQTGAWIPPPVVAIDMDVSEDGGSVKDSPHVYVDLEPGTLSQPPDVVPAQEHMNDTSPESDQLVEEPSVSSETFPEVAVAPATKTAAEPKSKKKNLTINKNMDQKFEKPTQTLEKQTVPHPPRKTRPTGRKEKKLKHYEEPPVKARIKTPKDPIYAEVKKLNVPSKSIQNDPTDTPSTSSGTETSPSPEAPTPPPRPSSITGDEDSKETSSTATFETDSTEQSVQLVNDLGRGDSKKKRVRHYRKKSEDTKRNSSQSSELNIQSSKEQHSEEPSGSSEKTKDKTPSDRVIYAELDFSQKVGLNILE